MEQIEEPKTEADFSGLLRNVVLFARLLRRAGMTVGTGQILDLTRALEVIDVSNRLDFYHTARVILVGRREDLPVFDTLFRLFWNAKTAYFLKERAAENRKAPLVMDPIEDCVPDQGDVDSSLPRTLEILDQDEANDEDAPEDDGTPRTQVLLAYSHDEILRHKDFENYTSDELQRARRLMQEMRWKIARRRTRRFEANPLGRFLDLRRTIRQNLRNGGEVFALSHRRHRTRPRPLVLICDISGSMDRYSRTLLQFLHTVEHGLDRVEAFVFATRLTRITRQLRTRDPGSALNEVSRAVQDWSGGTRIGEAIRTFNYTWSKRVLGRGAIVMVISDGWDRGDIEVLREEMERLQRNCYRLIWLNPLLGLPSYQPLTQGIQAALPYVDDFMPVHNLDSLEALGKHLQRIEGRRPTRRQKAGQTRTPGSGESFRDLLLAAPRASGRSANGAGPAEPPTFLYADAPTNSSERRR
ncbi:MAG: vWA domain-containing protein [Chloroflexota bacterium]